MIAAVLQRPEDIKILLHAGAAAKHTVQLPNGTHSAHSLATNEPPRTWFGMICPDTVDMFESSLTWSVESHYTCFHLVSDAESTLVRASHQLSHSVWMVIISHLPQNWAL